MKIDAIRKITEDFDEELLTSSPKRPVKDAHNEIICVDNLASVDSPEVDYDAVMYDLKERTFSFYKDINA